MAEIAPLLMFAVLFLLLASGFPVAFTLGGVSLLFGLSFLGLNFFNMLPLRIWGIMTNYVLIAVPLFVYMGVMLEKSGLAEELLETMALLFGRLRGGLAISVIIVGGMLAAATGIVGATVVTMGLLSLPTMLKRGYNGELASGVVASAGTLGQIIPPSIVLVLLASILNVPVGDMFLGALLPGIFLVVLYILWVIAISIFKPNAAPAMPPEELAQFTGMAAIKKVMHAFIPPFFLIASVLGSIFAGIASPTEAAAVGAFCATLLALIRGKLSFQGLRGVMQETTYLTSMVFIILVGATALGLVFRGMGGDRYLTNLIMEANMGPGVFLLILMIVVFIAGFFIDFIEITFIIVPIAVPILIGLNIDLLWVGILIAINLQTSFLTPPFGFSLFYLKGVAPKEVSTMTIYKGIIPFIIIQLIGLSMVVFFPELATWLPEYVLGK